MLRFLKITGKIIFYTVLLLLLGLGVVVVGLQLPSVQTRMVQEASTYLSEKLGMKVEVGGVSIEWFDKVHLQNVRINDDHRNSMIEIERLVADLNLNKLTDSTQVTLDKVRLVKPNVHLAQYPGSDRLNIDEFIYRINHLSSSDTTTSSKPTPFVIEQAEVEDGIFSMDDYRKAPMTEKGIFDYNHFTLHELNASVLHFKLVADSVSLGAENLRAVHRTSGLQIHELDTDFLYCEKSMIFNHLLARINNSVVRNYLAFHYKDQSDLGEFNTLVHLKANFDSTYIVPKDLKPFAPGVEQFHDRWVLNHGKFDGRVVDFKLQNADVYFGNRSRLQGNFAFKGMPEIEKTVMDFAVQKSAIQVQDLTQYIGKETTKSLQKFGNMAFEGTFSGLYTDFKTKGILQTDLGKANADLAMKLNDNSAKSSYIGNLELINFDLGKLIENQKLLQRIELKGRIEGTGFDVENAVVKVDGSARKVGFQGYDYTNLYVNGTLQKGKFDGRVSMKDTNLAFNLDGKVDLRQKGAELFEIKGKLAKANLKPLGITKEDMRLQSDLNVNFQGTDPDEMLGTGRFLNTYLSKGGRNLIIDSLFVFSFKPDSNRLIGINSDLLDFNAKGKFQLTAAIGDMAMLAKEYALYFFDNELNRQSYYTRKMFDVPKNYAVNFNLLLKNTDPLMAFFYPEGRITRNARFEGVFTMGNTSTFNFSGKADTLILGEYKFYKSDIDIVTSKFSHNPEVLASGIISSKNQKLNILAPTENLEMEASWDNDRIRFSGGLRQTGSTNRADLNGDLRFTQSGLVLSLQRSRFRLLDGIWKINPNNLMTVSGSDVCLRDLTFSNNGQSISLNGAISEDSTLALELKSEDFHLSTIAPVIELNLNGTVNGSVVLRDLYDNIYLDSDINIDELVYKDFLIGNVFGTGRWNKSKNIVEVDYHVDRMNNRILSLKGTYDPVRDDKAFNLLATLNQTNLEILEPFTEGLFKDFGGTATGKISITGSTNDPKVRGELDVKKGKLMFDYLKTVWNFEDKILFEDGAIRAKKMLLTDSEGNKATLRGGVYHDGFKYFRLLMAADMKNFKVMNTTDKDNELFYGTAYATGKLEIEGPMENLVLKADATSNRGTRIYIPLDRTQEIKSDDFIEYVDVSITKKDSVVTVSALKEVNLSGITMNFNLDVTPDATCEILFDRQTGEGIKTNGKGTINLRVDTKGDFNIVGNYEIDKGVYNFKFENVLDKQFQILAGSRISWSGDPYEALIDVKTAYTQYTSLKNLLPSTATSEDRPEYNRRYPVNVNVSMTGRLTQPQITYGLSIKDYPPSFNQAVTSFENRIKSNDQELNRQVSSVLALGQLIPDNASQFVQDNILNNLTELLSNQLSKLASQLDKNLEVDLSFSGGLNQDLMRNLQLRFSYNFNDRLRITRNGGFTNAYNQTDAATLIGDWSLEWLITSSGKLRLKAYNRNVQNPFSSLSNTATTTTGGASILFTESFNFLPWQKKKKRLGNTIGFRNDRPGGGTEEE
ncbi:MAG: translocation/assembly module TamB domain-containing protein [Spirosomataceae bacterium]